METKHCILTRRGYIISKNYVNSDILTTIKKELKVTPIIHPDYNEDVESFELYRENDVHMILPRYYGIEKLGSPIDTLNLKSKKINIQFTGKLRKEQNYIVNLCLDKIKTDGGGIISVGCGQGKCIARDTPVLLWSGLVLPVQQIKVGDFLMGDDGEPRKVLSLARGREEMFDIIPIKGDKYTVNKSHILSLKSLTNHSEKIYKGAIIDISVVDFLKLPKYFHGKCTPLRGYRVPIKFPLKKLELDPYMLGYWLGDGYQDKTLIITKNQEIVDYFTKNLKKYNLSLKQRKNSLTIGNKQHYNITTGKYNSARNNCNKNNLFFQQLKQIGVLNNKHIPNLYKCNSRKNQLELLAGIIDSDGNLNNNCYYICSQLEELIDDIIYIARSLGLAAYKSKCYKTCINNKGISKIGTYYSTNIQGDTSIIPVKLNYKKAKNLKQIKDVLVYSFKIKYVGIDDYYGFEIDGNRRFLLGDFTVTHNTVMAINLISKLKVKTLVIVHKTFLQNQWIERIQQFSDAKIGIIRRNKVDVEGKDIIIGMLQSISMKDYNMNIFNDIGFVCVDECFPYNQLVNTFEGNIPIGELFKKWNSNNYLPLILSYNEILKIFEYKKITFAWEKMTSSLIMILVQNNIIKCTPNHKFLTIDGYKKASKLNLSDQLIGMKNNMINYYNIDSINYINSEEKVYDIEILDNHNFLILTDSLNNIVVHNCHHIGSRVFSRALYKAGAKYTLGLSATPTRSDGLTKVINWYLGPILYKMTRNENKNVNVKVFNYETDDKLFMEKKLWIKGKMRPSVQKMITNLYQIESRNNFIINIIYNLLQIEGRKIIILSGRIDHLKKLYDLLNKKFIEKIKEGIIEPNEFSVSFYIGKMKQRELELASKSDVIFGSYEMAQEGLDIDDLNTLVFATPKKNIIQSIGRIMRKPLKQGDVNPLIVDIIDQYSCFTDWGEKRVKYYESKKFEVCEYSAWKENIISIKDFLLRKKIIRDKNNVNIDVREKFLSYKYGLAYYELEKELGFVDNEEEKYNYEPDLYKILEKNNLMNLEINENNIIVKI
ncbi:Superfamily II DNA or RNA helicase [uncultured virus]|nr:Superfamily II DNA or RNA helicase [uncultured virus]